MKNVRIMFALSVKCGLIAMTGCGGSKDDGVDSVVAVAHDTATETSGGSDSIMASSDQALPEGFPSNFPIQRGAEIVDGTKTAGDRA